MRRRKPIPGFTLNGLFCWCITLLLTFCYISQQCIAVHLEERMQTVRRILKEVPLIDGYVYNIFS